MADQSADQWIVISALMVGGIYAYRRATETPASSASLKGIAGQGAPVPLGAFVTAWGTVFFVISIMGAADPNLGKAFALLVAGADFIANGQQISKDISQKITAVSTPSSSSSAAAPIPTSTAITNPTAPFTTGTSTPFSGTLQP